MLLLGCLAGGCLGLLVAQTTGKHSLMQEDIGVYNAALSSPGTLSSATLTQASSDITSRCGSKCALFLTQGLWSLTTNHTITQPLVVPYGTRVQLASGTTLTLAACPKIDAPGWLQPGTTGKVTITAPGCPIRIELYATGGNGKQSTPWTGWDTALSWQSGGSDNTQNSHSGQHYIFGCGNYTQTVKIIVPNAYSYVMGDPAGGVGCVHIDFYPAGSADSDGYYTAWEFGTRSANGGTLWGRFENVELWSHDLTKTKRGIHILDMRHMTIRNVSLMGGDAGCTSGSSSVAGIGWCDTATWGTIGVHVEGREFIHIEDSFIVANRPAVLNGTPPGKGSPANIDYNLDISAFTNVSFWQVPSSIPITAGTWTQHAAPLYFDPNVFITNFDITGSCSLIGGEHAIYFDNSGVDPLRTPATQNITIANCRGEGFESTNYRFWFVGQPSTSASSPQTLAHNLKFTNIVWGTSGESKGFWLDHWAYVLFDSCNLQNANYGYHMDNLPTIAVHLGVNTYPVTFLNSWVVDATFVEMTGNQCVYFSSGAGGRMGPFRGAPVVVVDANDLTVGCTQLPFTPPIPAYPATPVSATSPPMNVGQPFTPKLIGDTGPASDNNSYAQRYGYWTRAGKMITVFARVVLTTKGTWAGNVSLWFANDAVATGNKPPPPPSALQQNNQGLTVRYGNVTLPASTTQLAAVLAPHYNEPSGTEPANNPATSGNVLFQTMGSSVAPGLYLDWSALTNTSVLEVSGTYMTEH